MVFQDANTGAFACWDNDGHVRGIAPDGHETHDYLSTTYRITSISPPPGTPIGRNDTLTVQLVPVDWSQPPAFRPCDWVTTHEASQIFGVPSVSAVPAGDEAGSVHQLCNYNTRGPEVRQLVGSTLMLPGSMVIDAPTQLDLFTTNKQRSDITGLPGRAYCTDSGELYVLLSGGRMYMALGSNGASCDTLKQFAQTAISRIGG
jgi:hypothetical protein